MIIIPSKDLVCSSARKNNFISINDLNLKNTELIVQKRYENKFEEAQYFREEVRKELNNILGNKNLYSEGFIVKTTIDTKIQKIANEVFINGLIQYDIKQGWRGPILNLNSQLITDNNFTQNFKNPFPSKWNLAQIITIKDDSIIVIDNLYTLYFAAESLYIIYYYTI